MKKIIAFLFAFMIGILFPADQIIAETGNTTVAKWKDNKKGAYSLRFDDSMMSHYDHTIPNLVSRGLVGSFFVNPGTNRYGYGIDAWESQASRIGIELCPHTMNHIGAGDYADADYEIGESYQTVWRLSPPDKSKLYPFSRGGGTTWPSGYREAVQNKYPVASYESDAVRYNGADDKGELIAFAKQAIKDEAWHMVLTHGTGPNLEWLGFEVSNFEALLDYLASAKDKLWVGNIGDIHKYVKERESAKVSVKETTNNIIRLSLTSDVDAELYDYPLTLISEVPSNWEYCHVNQSDLQSIYPVKSGKVMYEARPNRGEITLKNSRMDETPPAKITVRDGTAEDIDATLFTTRISANWDMAEDEESGIFRYWYKIGTTPGGAEVLDWIDNGLVRKVSTSRNNLSLSRGETYYITVKAVNGVGLSSISTSDGFTVNKTPDFISFREDFDNGYLSQWDVNQTRNSSRKNIMYISDQAAHDGKFGIQCHIENGETNEPYIAKNNVKASEVCFTRFYLKLDPNLEFGEEENGIQLLELRDAGGDFVAGVYLGKSNEHGFHVFARSRDNKEYTASLPGTHSSYPLSYLPVEKDKWIQVDLRTVAHEGKGGADLYVDGTRKGVITNRFTGGMEVNTIRVGIIDLSGDSISGDLYIDNITVSDSYLK